MTLDSDGRYKEAEGLQVQVMQAIKRVSRGILRMNHVHS
jgi:hypothetical protein